MNDIIKNWQLYSAGGLDANPILLLSENHESLNAETMYLQKV